MDDDLFTRVTGGCGQQNHHLTEFESNLGLASLCQGFNTDDDTNHQITWKHLFFSPARRTEVSC